MVEYVMGDRLQKDFVQYLEPRMEIVRNALAVLNSTQGQSRNATPADPKKPGDSDASRQ